MFEMIIVFVIAIAIPMVIALNCKIDEHNRRDRAIAHNTWKNENRVNFEKIGVYI